MDLKRVVSVLNSYGGRDKTIRLGYFLLVLLSERVKDGSLAEKLMAVARQMGTARMVGRRFGDLPLLATNLKLLAAPKAEVNRPPL